MVKSMSRAGMVAGAALAALSGAAAHAQTVALPGAASPSHAPFDAVVVFGDSLSDSGDTSLAAGASTLMRYTTNPGHVALENVAAAYGLSAAPSLGGGTDFAYGGAGVTQNSPGTPNSVPTETAQISGYLAGRPSADPRALYSVFAGANDIFSAETSVVANGIAQGLIAQATAGQSPAQAAVTTANLTSLVEAVAGVPSLFGIDQANAVISAAGKTEGGLVGRLQAAGARNVLVFNLPDIGLTPSAAAQGPAAAAQLTQLSASYNAALDAEIAQHPRGVIPVDAFGLIREAVANSGRFGYVNATTPACTVSSSFACTPATLVAPDAASTYFFADGVHPTTITHELFAQAILSEIAAPSYISLLAEAPLAVSTAQRGAWSDELTLDETDPAARTRVFARVGYDEQSFKSGPYAVGAGDDGETATVGFDWRPAPRASLGAVVTGARSFANFDDGYAKFRADTLTASVFGQYRVLQGGYVEGAVGAGTLDFDDIARSFALGAFRQQERGSTDGATLTATLGGGWWFGGPRLKLGPYAQAQYEHVRVEGYGEEGTDSTTMTFGTQVREAVVGEFGLRARGRFRLGPVELAPYATLAYDHDGRAGVRYVDAGLVDMPGVFSLPGYQAARDWGTLQAGVEARFGRGWSVFAGYQGRFADDAQDLNAANVGLTYSF